MSMLSRLCLGHLVLKLVAVVFVLACDKHSEAHAVVCLLLIGAESALSSFKTARKMITAKWWTIVNPDGQVQNFVQVTDSRHRDDELPLMKAFWTMQLVFCGVWGLVCVGLLHQVPFCAVPVAALYLHFRLLKFRNNIEKELERNELQTSITASTDFSVNIDALKAQYLSS